MSVNLSLEFFPPKTAEGADKLRAVRARLYALQPEFCSVTFGAGGSTQEGTLDTVRAIVAEGWPGVPHLSCIGQTAASIRERLASYRAAGVRRLVALRGDLPSGYGMGRIPPRQRPGGLHPCRNRRSLPHRGGRLP